MKLDLRREWPALLAIAAAFLVTATFYPRLPEVMPTHWNVYGQVDGYSSRLVGAWLTPLLTAGLYLLLLALPAIDPRKRNYERFEPTYRLFRIGIVWGCCSLSCWRRC